MGASTALPCAVNVDLWITYFQVISESYQIPGRWDSEDCVQECCVELTMLLDVMDPTDPEFSAELKTRVFRRLIDMQRFAFRPTHDVRREIPMPENADETLMDSAPHLDPAELVAARDLELTVGNQLKGHQKMVWRELVSPSARLGKCLSAFRRKSGVLRHAVPIEVYAEATGLSGRQVRYALEKIREVAKAVFATEGELSHVGVVP